MAAAVSTKRPPRLLPIPTNGLMKLTRAGAYAVTFLAHLTREKTNDLGCPWRTSRRLLQTLY